MISRFIIYANFILNAIWNYLNLSKQFLFNSLQGKKKKLKIYLLTVSADSEFSQSKWRKKPAPTEKAATVGIKHFQEQALLLGADFLTSPI